MSYFSVETKRHLKKALLAIPGVIREDGDAFLLNLGWQLERKCIWKALFQHSKTTHSEKS